MIGKKQKSRFLVQVDVPAREYIALVHALFAEGMLEGCLAELQEVSFFLFEIDGKVFLPVDCIHRFRNGIPLFGKSGIFKKEGMELRRRCARLCRIGTWLKFSFRNPCKKFPGCLTYRCLFGRQKLPDTFSRINGGQIADFA